MLACKACASIGAKESLPVCPKCTHLAVYCKCWKPATREQWEAAPAEARFVGPEPTNGGFTTYFIAVKA
jgi:hypothetical protein